MLENRVSQLVVASDGVPGAEVRHHVLSVTRRVLFPTSTTRPSSSRFGPPSITTTAAAPFACSDHLATTGPRTGCDYSIKIKLLLWRRTMHICTSQCSHPLWLHSGAAVGIVAAPWQREQRGGRSPAPRRAVDGDVLIMASEDRAALCSTAAAAFLAPWHAPTTRQPLVSPQPAIPDTAPLSALDSAAADAMAISERHRTDPQHALPAFRRTNETHASSDARRPRLAYRDSPTHFLRWPTLAFSPCTTTGVRFSRFPDARLLRCPTIAARFLCATTDIAVTSCAAPAFCGARHNVCFSRHPNSRSLLVSLPHFAAHDMMLASRDIRIRAPACRGRHDATTDLRVHFSCRSRIPRSKTIVSTFDLVSNHPSRLPSRRQAHAAAAGFRHRGTPPDRHSILGLIRGGLALMTLTLRRSLLTTSGTRGNVRKWDACISSRPKNVRFLRRPALVATYANGTYALSPRLKMLMLELTDTRFSRPISAICDAPLLAADRPPFFMFRGIRLSCRVLALSQRPVVRGIAVRIPRRPSTSVVHSVHCRSALSTDDIFDVQRVLGTCVVEAQDARFGEFDVVRSHYTN
ncbi:hypothetical protein GGX14DRAFT_658508 [Mycena pura]|uniref:Uncharacterized protein n=1 Tax=Mycena pura TaxID=153505 RepID=A0AAD6YMS2_9AGAR|nr:hypothetical protein GGX14DRAFT_658508 [Mycena pura]